MASMTLGILLFLLGGGTFVHMRSPHLVRAYTYRGRRAAKRQARVHPADSWWAVRRQEYGSAQNETNERK